MYLVQNTKLRIFINLSSILIVCWCTNFQIGQCQRKGCFRCFLYFSLSCFHVLYRTRHFINQKIDGMFLQCKVIMCMSSRRWGVEKVKYTEGYNRMDTVPLKYLLYFYINCHGISSPLDKMPQTEIHKKE